MTADIKLGAFKPVKPNAIKWSRSIDDYSDTATIRLPAIAKMKRDGDKYYLVDTGKQFTEGMKAEIYAGYDNKNDLRFKGFIRRINFTEPLEIECEGYSYQLRKKEGYNRSWAAITVKEILTDLISGTDIKLSDLIPDIPLKNIWFKNVKGTDVLEYLKTKCLLTLYFNYDMLYCGLKEAEVKTTVNHRLNWNVVKDNELKFESGKELATVNIQLERRNPDGSKQKIRNTIQNGDVKVEKIANVYRDVDLKAIAQRLKSKLTFRGYEGSITGFLKPYAEPGMATKIDDKRYPERNGTYFIEKVEGEFSKSGGRQRIHIGALLAKNNVTIRL